MLCSSLYSNLLHEIMQFVRSVSEGTTPAPPWHNINHNNQTTPPWRSENDATDTQRQTDRQRQYGDFDSSPNTIPPALWMDDDTRQRSDEFSTDTHDPVTNYHDYYADTFEYGHASNHFSTDGLNHGRGLNRNHESRTNYSDDYTESMPEQREIPIPRRPVRIPTSKKIFTPSDYNEADEKYENEAWKVDKRSQHTSNKSHKAKTTGISAGEVRRSWPEPREKGERRIIAANYSAVEIHGFFGLIDDGSVGEGRMLIVHVPKWIRGYFLDIKQGDTLHVYHASGGKIGGALTVLSTGRHKYYAPGRRVMTCTICVPEEQWAPYT